MRDKTVDGNDSTILSEDPARERYTGPLSRLASWLEARPVFAFIAILIVEYLLPIYTITSRIEDQWFILGNGKYIVKHGIPYHNPFTVWGGDMVMENWLYSLYAYGWWKMFGETQLGIWMMVWLTTLLASIIVWTIVRRHLKLKAPEAMLITMMAGADISTSFSVRPLSISLTLMLLSILVFMEWLKTRRRLFLVLLVPLTCLSFNMQMPMAWYTILVPGCFMLADVILVNKDRLRHFMSYVVTVALQIAVMFLNPYGYRGFMFFFWSMQSIKNDKYPSVENQSVYEVLTNSPSIGMIAGMAYFFIIVLLSLVGCVFTLLKSNGSSIAGSSSVRTVESNDIYSDGDGDSSVFDKTMAIGGIFLLAGVVIATMWAVRSASTYLLLFPIGCALLLKAFKWNIHVVRFLTFAFVLCLLGSQLALLETDDRFVNMDTLHEKDTNVVFVVDKVRENAEPGDPIYTQTNLGALVGYYGYKISNDMRPELVGKNKITNLPYDYYNEMIATLYSQKSADYYVSKYKDRFKLWAIYAMNGYMKKALESSPDFTRVASNDRSYVYKSNVYKNYK